MHPPLLGQIEVAPEHLQAQPGQMDVVAPELLQTPSGQMDIVAPELLQTPSGADGDSGPRTPAESIEADDGDRGTRAPADSVEEDGDAASSAANGLSDTSDRATSLALFCRAPRPRRLPPRNLMLASGALGDHCCCSTT